MLSGASQDCPGVYLNRHCDVCEGSGHAELDGVTRKVTVRLSVSECEAVKRYAEADQQPLNF